jgi:chromosome segregation ATPase
MSAVPDPRQHSNRTDERSSIDLSLELEHQLEHMELVSTHNTGSILSDSASTKEKRDSLDPHVLAHIIMQLRHSLTEVTKERDELIKALSSALSKEAELNDALQLITDKATDLEEELAEARKKVKESEEAITLLRSKVEESRSVISSPPSNSYTQEGGPELP